MQEGESFPRPYYENCILVMVYITEDWAQTFLSDGLNFTSLSVKMSITPPLPRLTCR